MTIVTQPITEKKVSKLQIPLVNGNGGVDTKGGVAVGSEKQKGSAVNLIANQDDMESGQRQRVPRSSLMVTVMRNRARRVSSLTTVCVFLTALLVFATGILGGVYLFRQFNQYKVIALQLASMLPTICSSCLLESQ